MSATDHARTRAPLVIPQPMAQADPVALAQWMGQLSTQSADAAAAAARRYRSTYARRLAVGRGPGRCVDRTSPDFPLPGADLGDFDFSALAVTLAQVGSQVGTSLFANQQQRQLAEQTASGTNASNAALASAQTQAAAAVSNALAAAKKQAATSSAPSHALTAAHGTASTSTPSGLLLYGSLGVIGLITFLYLVRK